jgi:hypothetical protein
MMRLITDLVNLCITMTLKTKCLNGSSMDRTKMNLRRLYTHSLQLGASATVELKQLSKPKKLKLNTDSGVMSPTGQMKLFQSKVTLLKSLADGK